MDIRRWLTSKSAAGGGAAPSKNESTEKEDRQSKKRKIESDSDEEISPRRKNQVSPKKGKQSSKNKDSNKGKFGKETKNKAKRKIESSDEEFIPVSDSDESSNKVRKTSQKKPREEARAKMEAPKQLKPKSASDFFGDAPVERSSKRTPAPKKPAKESVEQNHEDEDFEKTLLQLEEGSQSSRAKKKEGSVRPSETKRQGSSKKHHPSLEIIPSKKEKEKKKEVSVKEPVDTTKPKKPKGNASYFSYLEREGPRALGSKEIPEGEIDCLKGMTFLITGVLDAIERDDAKALIEKHGGKVMTTLSKNTKYIVIGRDAGSSKLEKAEKLGTIQLDEDGLFDLIRNTPGRGPMKKSVEKVADAASDVGTENSFQKFAFNKEASSPQKNQKKEGKKLDEAVEKKEVSLSSPQKPTTESAASSQSVKMPERSKTDIFEMWVDKYKPTSMKQIIGQQGDKSNAKKLHTWLVNWSKNTKNKKPAVAGRWNTADDGSGFKAALLSGPPGIGKTTTAHLVCKEAGFDFTEMNASDTRSKKMLQSVISELLQTQSLSGCFSGGTAKGLSSNHAIIMDEVDGMAGNEDRGGIQELIGFIKKSKVPIICICNDRNHPKIRSLSNYCFDLRFQKPRVEQIKAAMMSVAFKEGLSIAPNVLQDVIVASNQDIRQVLHNLSVWCAKEKRLTSEQAKEDIGYGIKNVKMGPFDVLREVFSIGNNKKASINDKAALFFHDYSIAPLFVQENYVHVLPTAAGGDRIKHLKLLSESADSICIGDLVDKQIRSNNSWSLLPVQAIYASVIPGELLSGHMKQMISFPAWLGKNSNRNHMDRILQELQMHMRMRITGNKTDVAMEYLPLLKRALTKPLLDKELDGIKEAVDVMGYYCLLREDFDSVVELSLWSQQADPRSKISSKVKSAFTRLYNKECVQSPYAVTNVSKKKRRSAKDDDEMLGEDGDYVSEEDDNEDDDKLENDAMIKVKKPKKTTPDDKEASSSSSSQSKSSKTASKRGRPKK